MPDLPPHLKDNRGWRCRASGGHGFILQREWRSPGRGAKAAGLWQASFRIDPAHNAAPFARSSHRHWL